MIGLASFVPTRRRNLIIYPTVLLCISVAVCSGFYLFNTDWFYRLLFQNFIGFGYTAWLAVLFLFLADVTMNEARVTMKLTTICRMRLFRHADGLTPAASASESENFCF